MALFAGTVAAEIAYLQTAEIQWTNFASWLNVGALLFGAAVLLWALVGWLAGRRRRRGNERLAYLLVVAIMWIVGLVNAFHHSQDGWSSVGTTGLILSVVSALLALVAGWLLFSGRLVGERRP